MHDTPPPTILLVDDEPEIRAALATGLSRGLPGAKVLTAGSAQAGLEMLRKNLVDIVISDQRMPGMEGVEFLVESRRISPTTARMMLTAYPEHNLLERNVNEARITHFFTKPCKLSEVVDVVRRAILEKAAAAAAALEVARTIEHARARVGPKVVSPPFVGQL